MARFATIGVGAGRPFDVDKLTPELRQAIEAGMADAWAEADRLKQQAATGKLSSGDIFGTRAFLKNNYAYRMLAAALGIYGNTKEEAMYPVYYTDSTGRPLNGANRYILHFAPGQLPPVHAFWSLTMYNDRQLFADNPIDRYAIGDRDDLAFNPDGSLDLYIQRASPGADKDSNWLPAPQSGSFTMNLRLYWPSFEVIDGRWSPPPVTLVE